MMTMTVGELLKALGFDAPASEIDETLKWVLVELYLRRQLIEDHNTRPAADCRWPIE